VKNFLKSVNIWQSCSVCKVHETTTLLFITLPTIHRFQTFFTRRLSNKPFLIWLLTIPPHRKYAATLFCNLSLMAGFADINVSQGSVATHAGCDGSFNTHLTTTLQRNFPVNLKKNCFRFDRIIVTSLWPTFWPTLYLLSVFTGRLKVHFVMQSIIANPSNDLSLHALVLRKQTNAYTSKNGQSQQC